MLYDLNKSSLLVPLASFKAVVEELIKKTNDPNDKNAYNKLSGQASIIIGYIEQDNSTEEAVDEAIDVMDRLFGALWPKNFEEFHTIFLSWDIFKALLTRSIDGMTVNERLYMFDLFKEFDKAVAYKDRRYLNEILSKCCLEEKNIQDIITQTIGNPA